MRGHLFDPPVHRDIHPPVVDRPIVRVPDAVLPELTDHVGHDDLHSGARERAEMARAPTQMEGQAFRVDALVVRAQLPGHPSRSGWVDEVHLCSVRRATRRQ